ncbi:serine--tRNA ligase [Candidatus Woesearchaeota archaeon]|nr:MAG: serine--tRNA ligase [Candidatus Woesearchaeota archaeon]
MLDIKFVRKYPDIIRENLRKRKEPEMTALLESVLKNDETWRKLKKEIDELREKRNKISQEINKARKQGKDAKKIIKEAKEIPKKIEQKEQEMKDLSEKIRICLLRIPNMLAEDVPYGKDDTENVVIKEHGKKRKFTFKPKSHVDIIKELDLVDLKRAAKISGARWYFLKNQLVILDMAIQRFAIDLLIKKGFTPISPPHMISKKAVQGATSLQAFEEDIYKIEKEDLYAIPTSEFPLITQFMNEVLQEKDLPIKMAGISPCYRKEAGAHGKDQKGIFRVHQFNKIEQVIICKQEESWKYFNELFKNGEEVIKKLEIPYRVVNLCTGDLGIKSSKTYDIEAWFPAQNAYREIGSCSNCLSYQAVRSNIRYQQEKERKYVHTLNNTMAATSRIMVAIIENFQNKDGTISIPKALQKYTGFEKIK